MKKIREEGSSIDMGLEVPVKAVLAEHIHDNSKREETNFRGGR